MRGNFYKILLFICMGMAAGNSFATSPNSLISSNFFSDNADGTRTLRHHVPKEVAASSLISHADRNQTLNLRVILPLQNQAQLSSLLKSIYDPASPLYHHYITPIQFTQQFGASQTDIISVREFLKSQGLSVASRLSNGFIMNVSGPVKAVEQAFNLHINNYQKSDKTIFYAPDADPTIPAPVVGKIFAINGLNNVVRIKSHAHQIAASPQIGTGPKNFLAPADIYKAYNLNGISSNGSGQTVALFELDGYTSSDITAYEAQFNLPNVPIQNELIDGFSGLPDLSGTGYYEVTLDIEILTGIAPGLGNILVYEAGNTESGWMDEWGQIAADNTAKVISCSWGLPEVLSADIAFDYSIFQQLAAQGQEVFVASGDEGAYDGLNTLTADEPAAQPYVTGVGISALRINSDGTYKSEIASTYSGGGVSAYEAIPSYQQGMIAPATLGSNTMRNVPDLALTADISTGYSFYISGVWEGFWGSSIAAPIWAGFNAIVNQGLANAGQSTLGFINPTLYAIAQSSAYTNDFHDIVGGVSNDRVSGSPYYPAVSGYDDATGLGSFNGANLYNDIVLLKSVQTITASASTNGTISPLGNIAVKYGSNQTFVVTPNLGYFINQLLVDGVVVSAASMDTNAYSYTFNNVTTAHAISASFGAIPLPSVPTGIKISAGNAQVTLSWGAATGALTYNVKRANVSGGPYTTISNTALTSYTDTTVTNNSLYYYVISALNSAGESKNSTQVNAKPLLPKPAGLKASAGNDQVILSWSAVTGAASYNIKRASVSGGPYTTVANAAVTNYTDTTVTNGNIYYYVVSAVSPDMESANSSQISMAPALPKPTGLKAIPGNDVVTLSWSTVTGAASYNVKRATVSGGPYITIATNVLNQTYKDITVTNGIVYYYVVSAVGPDMLESANSIQTNIKPVLPNPYGQKASAANGQVVFSWNAVTGATSYNVKRATVSGGPYTTIASVTVTKYTDTSVTVGSVYYYVVSAVSPDMESANSPQVQVLAT